MPLSNSPLVSSLTTGTTAPAAGKLGEQLISSVTSTSLPASGTWGDVTSLSLTAGVWDVSAYGNFGQGGAASTGAAIGISTTSGNSSSGLTSGLNRIDFSPPGASAWQAASIVAYRVVITSTTTYYFKASFTYTSTAPVADASLKAVRVA